MPKLKERLPFVKIIYFDNSTAIDYINIINEGEITIEEINKVIDETGSELNLNGEAKAKISLLNMLKLSVGLKSNVNLSSSSEKIVNSTLTTNMMVEFIKFAKEDTKIEQIKGYYEFIAKYENDKEIILRFNIDGFRNNYKFNDLSKMNLTYYAIKVGNCYKEDIKFENEINQEEKIVTIKDFDSKENLNTDLLDIYDVVLAGVENG